MSLISSQSEAHRVLGKNITLSDGTFVTCLNPQIFFSLFLLVNHTGFSEAFIRAEKLSNFVGEINSYVHTLKRGI